MVSVSQESKCGLTASESLIRLHSKGLLGLGSHLRLNLGRICFQAHVVLVRIWFLVGHWNESLRSQLAVSSWRLHVPAHVGFFTWWLTSSKPARERVISLHNNHKSDILFTLVMFCGLEVSHRFFPPSGRGLHSVWTPRSEYKWRPS